MARQGHAGRARVAAPAAAAVALDDCVRGQRVAARVLARLAEVFVADAVSLLRDSKGCRRQCGGKRNDDGS